ncbi:MAG: hypothetical protein RR472_06540, partial [Anaerovoracaceae bacterium]
MFSKMKIGMKILLVILAISLGTLLIISAGAYAYMKNLTEEFQRENIGLGKTASEDSKEALEQQAEDYLVRIAEKQAIASNEKLLQVSATVKEAVNYMDLLYSNPSNFRGSTVPKIEASEDSVASGKYMLSLGVENSRAIQQEVRLLSNCAYMFAPFLNNNNML